MSLTYREGGRVTIGDREFVVPKATMAVGRAVTDVQKKAASGEVEDGYLASAMVLQIILARANPDLTVEQLLDLVEVDLVSETLAKVQEAAGFSRRAPGEAASP